MFAFVDTVSTDLLQPQLLSIGLVSLDGKEFYAELDLGTEPGRQRRREASGFVRHGGVLDMWGRIPGAAGTEWELGRRAGEWLLALAGESDEKLEVAFDYPVDYELMEYAIRDAGLWDLVRENLSPINVNLVTGNINGELAAEACYRALSSRSIGRHYALADALSLRAAYQSVKDVAVRMARLERSGDFQRLRASTSLGEAWLRGWLVREQIALDQRRPLDVLDEPDGVERLVTLLQQIEFGVYL